MEELIAKKYIKAFDFNADIASMENVASIFADLAEALKDKKVAAIFETPAVSAKKKSEILLDAVKSANSNEINNLIMLLVENRRINVIPAIAKELKKEIARITKTHTGFLFSDTQIEEQTLEQIGVSLGKRFDSTIALTFIKNDFNGIKVEVEGLGIEIDFSKDRIDRQVIEHIIKAI